MTRPHLGRLRDALRRAPILGRILLLLGSLLFFIPRVVVALGSGDPAPPFDLPDLSGEGRTQSPSCFDGAPVTVLIIWDRGCPHCLDLALHSSALADSVVPHGARVLGIVMGPDDQAQIDELLWERGVHVPHLWDGDRTTAGPYDLGFKHIGIFLIDGSGTVRAHFDDRVEDLVEFVAPEVMGILEGVAASPAAPAQPNRPISTPPAAQSAFTHGWPALKIQGRLRMTATEGAGSGATGLFGEALESGPLFLLRWDARVVWNLGRRLVLEPWLRVSNESDLVLMEGEDQLSSRHGSLSLRYEDDHFRGVLGAYRLRLSPLALQRWDLDDVPPIGGGTGGVGSCGCAAGAAGLKQASLEVIGTDYTFEGVDAALKTRGGQLRGWIAIPRMEDARELVMADDSRQVPRYRRVVYGGALDLGEASALRETVFGLPTPFGLRVGSVWMEDDRRSLVVSPFFRPEERDERVVFLLGSLGPWKGLSLDGECAELKSPLDSGSPAQGFRAGVRGEGRAGRIGVWGRVHRFEFDPGFEPYYSALTYEANRVGWRGAIGTRVFPNGRAVRECLALTLFLRSSRRQDPPSEPAGSSSGTPRWNTYDISVLARPQSDLPIGVHFVFVRSDEPILTTEVTRKRGLSVDVGWEGIGALRPQVRMDYIDAESTVDKHARSWQIYASAAVLK